MFVLYLSKQGLPNLLQQSSLTYHCLKQTSFLLLRKFPRNLFLPSGFLLKLRLLINEYFALVLLKLDIVLIIPNCSVVNFIHYLKASAEK